jgi:REP element-mobilizing transposase RayT
MGKEGIYKNKFRMASARHPHWDYSQCGFYFVTICTKEKKFYFGNIKNRDMQYTYIGKIAKKFWQDIPSHFPFVKLHEYIIMPNHVHGIIQIVQKCRDAKSCVSTASDTSDEYKNKFGAQRKNLSSIIRGYKAGVAKNATINNIVFCWQARFYDRIIRSEKELNKTRTYIVQNIERWELDKSSPENIYM